MAFSSNKRPQVLQITPAHEIVLKGPFNHVVTSYLELYNPSKQRVCFKVKTTAPRRYCVRPNSGLVKPDEKIKIAIMLQPIDDDSQSERNKHKFMVQSVVVNDEDTNAENVWTAAKPEDIMDSKLRCVFHLPSLSEDSENTTQSEQINSSTSPISTNVQNSSPNSKSTQEKSPLKLIATGGDGRVASQQTNEILSRSFAHESKNRNTANVSSSSGRQTKKSDDKSVSYIHHSTSSFLQPMSEDFNPIFLLSLAMLIIGIILGKYII